MTHQPIPEHHRKKLVRILGHFYSGGRGDGQEEYASAGGPSTFGVWLARLREEQGLKQRELADKARLSAHTISNIETGRFPNPIKITIERLEQALGKEFPAEVKEEVREEATIKGVGEVVDVEEVKSHDLTSHLLQVCMFYMTFEASSRMWAKERT